MDSLDSDTHLSKRSSSDTEYVVCLENKLNECVSQIINKDKEHEYLKINYKAITKKSESLQEDLDITEGELSIYQRSEKEWIGISLKLKFILDEIKKIGALPEDHASWVYPMVDDVNVPDVSINIKSEFIPTAQTENIDWVSSDEGYEGDEGDEGDEEHYFNGEYSDDSIVFSTQLHLSDYSYPMTILENSSKIIQKAWSNYRQMKKELLDNELDDFMSLPSESIELVMNQACVSCDEAVKALKNHNSDIVNAIFSLCHIGVRSEITFPQDNY